MIASSIFVALVLAVGVHLGSAQRMPLSEFDAPDDTPAATNGTEEPANATTAPVGCTEEQFRAEIGQIAGNWKDADLTGLISAECRGRAEAVLRRLFAKAVQAVFTGGKMLKTMTENAELLPSAVSAIVRAGSASSADESSDRD